MFILYLLNEHVKVSTPETFRRNTNVKVFRLFVINAAVDQTERCLMLQTLWWMILCNKVCVNVNEEIIVFIYRIVEIVLYLNEGWCEVSS